jgi:transcriptional regulator with XRE-family HTH domain
MPKKAPQPPPVVIYQRAPHPSFGNLLLAMRKQSGLSQLQVAALLGNGKRRYYKIERGKRRPWTDPHLLDRLSNILGLSADARDQLYRLAGVLPPELMPIFAQVDLIAICQRGASFIPASSDRIPVAEKEYKIWGSGQAKEASQRPMFESDTRAA